MVVAHVKMKGSSEYKRESWVNPQHYIKWRTLLASKIVDIKPVRSSGYKRR